MNRYDILIALQWLSWRLYVRNRNYSQAYLDRMAEKQLHGTAADTHVSEKVKQLAQAGIAVKGPGKPDQACITLFKTVLREADEAEFKEMLIQNPRNLVKWRKLWDGIRGNHIRRI